VSGRTSATRDGVLGGQDLLDRVQAGLIVTDRQGSVRFANEFAASLLGYPGPGALPVGASLAGIGLEQGEPGKVDDLTAQVLRGRAWEGTFAAVRQDSSRVFVRAQAVPLREASGEISGIMILARPVSRPGQQRERDRISVLERISDRLSGSLELDVTLRSVAEMLVPQFADHCFIDLLQGDKLIRRAQLHAGGWMPHPGTWAMVGEQISYPPGHFCEQAMSRMETVVVPDMRDGHYPAPSAASLRVSDDVGLTSVIAAPLVARGELLGVMSLALSRLTAREDRNYGPDDRDFLAAIAGRVAVAIDNAMLFEEERRTALAFQTSLLPQDPPALDGLEVAYSYVPAKPLETHGQGIQTQVGGDWYDIIRLSAGRAGIVIGDVEGRGARAAAVMGQLRAALRAFAQDDRPPGEILSRLDDWYAELGPSPDDGPGHATPDAPTVSCTYLVYDAWTRRLSYANAGHAAPLLITGAGVEQLEIANEGLLLGVRGHGIATVPFSEESRYLPPGSTLVFYTDGLTDRRQRADGRGHYTEAEALAMLCEAVERAAGGTVEAVAAAAEHAVPGDIDDDMAIVVVRTSPADLSSWEAVFAAEPVRVPEARQQAGEVFHRWGLDAEQADLACLLVSEVVTNVVLHASGPAGRRQEFAFEAAAGPVPDGGWGPAGDPAWSREPAGREFTLRLRRGQASIWAEVFDSDLRLPRLRSAGENDEGGRGLYLVQQLSTRWGTRPTPEGKAVWFELPIKAGSG
jgi:serine phosphatase RsbU (regulator of sigma subunit)